MKRLHALSLLAVLGLISIGCDSQHGGAQSNTAPTPNTTPAQLSTPQNSPTPKSQGSPSPARELLPLPKNTAEGVRSPDPKEIQARASQTKAFVAGWIRDARLTAKRSRHLDAKYAATLISHPCYGVLAQSDGEIVIQFSGTSLTHEKSCIQFATLTPLDRQAYPAWDREISMTAPVTYIEMTMVFNREVAEQLTNPYLRGLIVLHEMMHWRQTEILQLDPKAQKFAMELSAYDYEFKLMDRLKLSGYKTFLAEELGKEQPWDQTPYMNDPRIEQIFGPPLSPNDKIMLAQLLHWRVMFKQFEADPKTEVANKARFMAPLL